MEAYEYIPKLIRAAINNDRKSVESLALMIGRQLKKVSPEVSSEIMKVLSYTNVGADVTRSIDLSPLPVDQETRGQLVKLEEPIRIEEPILRSDIREQLDDFLKERLLIDTFLKENIVPSNSILLSGMPGVGKTYIAKWLSYKLNMPMVTLDLANSISSYLGRSGQNIKSIFQYTKEQSVILFLDEMDAIAKRRDDASDLGELKRLVNVLLKELEDCPINCIIIGATNHPELLDKAIWRRFDRNIEIMMPQEEQREKLIYRTLAEKAELIKRETLELIIKGTDQLSAADICKLCEHIKRQFVMNSKELADVSALREYCRVIGLKEKEDKIKICKELKDIGKSMTIQKISDITRIPFSTVGRYLKE